MEPVLSPDKEKVGPLPCTAGTEHYLLLSPVIRPLDNKNGEFDKAHIMTGIIVTSAATGNKTDDGHLIKGYGIKMRIYLEE